MLIPKNKCKNGHTVVIDEAIQASCSQEGLTEGSHCSVCGEVIATQNKIPKLEHNFNDVLAIDPTCTEEGCNGYKLCTVCGYAEPEIKIIPALGHTVVVDSGKEATETEDGLTEGSHCSVCGIHITEQKVVPALGHHFGNYVSDNNATCMWDGTKTAICTTCGMKDTITDVGTKKEHTESDWIIDRQAGCVTAGAKHTKCNMCNQIIKSETIPCRGYHTYVNGVCSACGNHENGSLSNIGKDAYHFLTIDQVKKYYTCIFDENAKNMTNGKTLLYKVYQVSFLDEIGNVRYYVDDDHNTIHRFYFSTELYGDMLHPASSLSSVNAKYYIENINSKLAAFLGTTPAQPKCSANVSDIYASVAKGSCNVEYEYVVSDGTHSYTVNLTIYGGVALTANIGIPTNKDFPFMKN